jgi:hypothetical protein
MARHETALLVSSAAVLAFLFLFHMLDPADVPLSADLVNVMAIALVGLLFVAIAWKGLVPAAICTLGVVLLHNAIILPYYPPGDDIFPHLLLTERRGVGSAEDAAGVAFTMHFLLGIGMVTMGMVVAYAPKLMFTRNRPEEKDSVWSKYPIWYDNVKLAGRYSEPLVPAKSLMEDRDRYMLWRYEYVLANIYGAPHLVRPDGLVPEKSTEFLRDRDSGLLMGMGKYDGYFV